MMDWVYFIVWLILILVFITKFGVWMDKTWNQIWGYHPSRKERIEILQNQNDALDQLINQDDNDFFIRHAKNGKNGSG